MIAANVEAQSQPGIPAHDAVSTEQETTFDRLNISSVSQALSSAFPSSRDLLILADLFANRQNFEKSNANVIRHAYKGVIKNWKINRRLDHCEWLFNGMKFHLFNPDNSDIGNCISMLDQYWNSCSKRSPSTDWNTVFHYLIASNPHMKMLVVIWMPLYLKIVVTLYCVESIRVHCADTLQMVYSKKLAEAYFTKAFARAPHPSVNPNAADIDMYPFLKQIFSDYKYVDIDSFSVDMKLWSLLAVHLRNQILPVDGRAVLSPKLRSLIISIIEEGFRSSNHGIRAICFQHWRTYAIIHVAHHDLFLKSLPILMTPVLLGLRDNHTQVRHQATMTWYFLLKLLVDDLKETSQLSSGVPLTDALLSVMLTQPCRKVLSLRNTAADTSVFSLLSQLLLSEDRAHEKRPPLRLVKSSALVMCGAELSHLTVMDTPCLLRVLPAILTHWLAFSSKTAQSAPESPAFDRGRRSSSPLESWQQQAEQSASASRPMKLSAIDECVFIPVPSSLQSLLTVMLRQLSLITSVDVIQEHALWWYRLFQRMQKPLQIVTAINEDDRPSSIAHLFAVVDLLTRAAHPALLEFIVDTDTGRSLSEVILVDMIDVLMKGMIASHHLEQFKRLFRLFLDSTARPSTLSSITLSFPSPTTVNLACRLIRKVVLAPLTRFATAVQVCSFYVECWQIAVHTMIHWLVQSTDALQEPRESPSALLAPLSDLFQELFASLLSLPVAFDHYKWRDALRADLVDDLRTGLCVFHVSLDDPAVLMGERCHGNAPPSTPSSYLALWLLCQVTSSPAAVASLLTPYYRALRKELPRDEEVVQTLSLLIRATQQALDAATSLSCECTKPWMDALLVVYRDDDLIMPYYGIRVREGIHAQIYEVVTVWMTEWSDRYHQTMNSEEKQLFFQCAESLFHLGLEWDNTPLGQFVKSVYMDAFVSEQHQMTPLLQELIVIRQQRAALPPFEPAYHLPLASSGLSPSSSLLYPFTCRMMETMRSILTEKASFGDPIHGLSWWVPLLQEVVRMNDESLLNSMVDGWNELMKGSAVALYPSIDFYWALQRLNRRLAGRLWIPAPTLASESKKANHGQEMVVSEKSADAVLPQQPALLELSRMTSPLKGVVINTQKVVSPVCVVTPSKSILVRTTPEGIKSPLPSGRRVSFNLMENQTHEILGNSQRRINFEEIPEDDGPDSPVMKTKRARVNIGDNV